MTLRPMVPFVWVALVFPLLAGAQENETPTDRDRSRDEVAFDFAFEHDPRELYQRAVDKIRWRRIVGPVGIGRFHIFPAQETGPNLGPAKRIWGDGFGTSLWRDPITGWPIQ